MKRKALVLTVTFALSSLHLVASAQTGAVQPAYKIPSTEKPKEGEPGKITLGDGVTLSPYFNLSLGRDDNLFLSEVNQRSSKIALYNPGLKLDVAGASTKFVLGYDLKTAKYADSSGDDYTDYKIFSSSEIVISSSLGLKLAGDYTKGHDPRGSTDRGIAGNPDEFRTVGPSFLAAYGGNDAKGRIEFEAGYVDKEYLNNRATTTASDRKNDSFAGRFFLRVAPKTSALIEMRREKVDYALSSSTQDSKETRVLVGLTWDATAATSGTIKVGQIKKDFDVATRKDFSGTGWEASVNWKPLSYSTVDFFTAKSFNESTGLGDFLLNKRYGSTWTHGWNSDLQTVVSLTRSEDEFAANPRRDKTDSVGLKLNYKLARWLTIGGEYTSAKRDSNVSGLDYKKNTFLFTLGATL
jgi:polysaccharide biosynthesis protein VpsM